MIRKEKKSRSLNWEEARERLRKAGAALEEATKLSPERARDLMERRARDLARPPQTDAGPRGSEDFVVFTLGEERYALAARSVREVVRLVDLAALPGVASHFAGVTNVRGEIILVVDLRSFFGIPAKGVTDLSRVIVLGNGAPEFGLLADAVHEVLSLRREDIEDPPESISGIGREYLTGLTREATIVLNPDVLLKHPRLFLEPMDQRAP